LNGRSLALFVTLAGSVVAPSKATAQVGKWATKGLADLGAWMVYGYGLVLVGIFECALIARLRDPHGR